MAPLSQVGLAVADSADPAPSGGSLRLPPHSRLDVADGRYGIWAAVQGNEAGGIRQHVAVRVDEAREHRPPSAVDDLGMRASGPAADLAIRADSQDALALDSDSLGARPPRVHGDDARIVEHESSGSTHCAINII